jgi:arylsulfatase
MNTSSLFRSWVRGLGAAVALAVSLFAPASSEAGAQPATARKPNILIIFGDDIGTSNVDADTLSMKKMENPKGGNN